MGAVKEQFILDEQGERIAVILPLDEYEQLEEDIHDLAVAAERRTESTITLEELNRQSHLKNSKSGSESSWIHMKSTSGKALRKIWRMYLARVFITDPECDRRPYAKPGTTQYP